MRDIARNDLVILDEFGYVPLDLDSARLLFQGVSDCYERHSLVITTNIEFSKWGTVLGDDKMAAAMIDRIVHHGRLVEFTGASHRMERRSCSARRWDRLTRRVCQSAQFGRATMFSLSSTQTAAPAFDSPVIPAGAGGPRRARAPPP